MGVPVELLAILRCVECHGTLADDGPHLRCVNCGVCYPVEDDVPVMLPESIIRPGEEDRP